MRHIACAPIRATTTCVLVTAAACTLLVVAVWFATAGGGDASDRPARTSCASVVRPLQLAGQAGLSETDPKVASQQHTDESVASRVAPDSSQTTTPPATQAGAILVDSHLNFSVAGALAWGDYDNDGDLDLVIAGHDHMGARTAIYRNDGGTFTRTQVQITGVWNAAVAWADFDLDGDLDLAIAGQTPTGPVTRIYQNHGGAFTPVQAGLTGAGFSALAWGDINNDGQPDLVVSGANRVWLYQNNNGLFEVLQARLGGAQFGWLDFGDYDGDGRIDLAVSGEYNSGRGFEPVTHIFRNLDGQDFVKVDAGLPQLANSMVAWSDYDNDGDLDLAVCGFTPDGAVCRIYRNDGQDTFTHIQAPLTGVGAGAIAWGDVDNDGKPDLVIAGFFFDRQAEAGQGQPKCLTRLYRNLGGDQFAAMDVDLEGVHYGSVAFGDYDNDGKLDLAVSGVNCSNQPVTRLYRNQGQTPNTPPEPPSNLVSEIMGDSVTFRWDAGSDAETPVAGLFYQLRVGSRPGADDVYAAMADLVTGQRRRPGLAGAHQRLSWTVTGLKDPPYYWSVQTVDTGFAGSAWAPEATVSWARVHNPNKNAWYETIQSAIDESDDGDEIILNPGIYSGPGNWDLSFASGLEQGITRHITVRGLDPDDPDIVARTIIDCEAIPSRSPHRAFRFASGEHADAVVAGLTIRNAKAPSFGDISADGGAIFCAGSSPTIRQCVFDSCGSPSRGGAIAIIGGPSWYASPSIRHCTFVNNRADLGGGALYMADSHHLILENCIFRGNSSRNGGALLAETQSPGLFRVQSCVFDANVALQTGGAISALAGMSMEVVNCTFANNLADQGGGVHITPHSNPSIINSILWGNRSSAGTGESAQIWSDQMVWVVYSCVQGWTGAMGGTHTTGEDPGFVDIDGADDDPATWHDNRLELSRTSPCINAGDPHRAYVGLTDVTGAPRVQSCRTDMGAYESPWSLPRADFTGDCHVDREDLRFFIMCATGPGILQTDPACIDADFDGDGDVDSDDFAVLQRCWSGPHHFAEPRCDQ